MHWHVASVGSGWPRRWRLRPAKAPQEFDCRLRSAAQPTGQGEPCHLPSDQLIRMTRDRISPRFLLTNIRTQNLVLPRRHPSPATETSAPAMTRQSMDSTWPARRGTFPAVHASGTEVRVERGTRDVARCWFAPAGHFKYGACGPRKVVVQHVTGFEQASYDVHLELLISFNSRVDLTSRAGFQLEAS